MAQRDGVTATVTGRNGVVFLTLDGGEIFLTPVPDPGYRFAGWNDLEGISMPEKEDEPAENGDCRSEGSGTKRFGTALFKREDSDLTPPQVASVTPNGSGVSLSVNQLTVTFDRPMTPVWNEDRTTLIYNLSGLNYSTTYTVTIDGFMSAREV